jgi:hypothetical protein
MASILIDMWRTKRESFRRKACCPEGRGRTT